MKWFRGREWGYVCNAGAGQGEGQREERTRAHTYVCMPALRTHALHAHKHTCTTRAQTHKRMNARMHMLWTALPRIGGSPAPRRRKGSVQEAGANCHSLHFLPGHCGLPCPASPARDGRRTGLEAGSLRRQTRGMRNGHMRRQAAALLPPIGRTLSGTGPPYIGCPNHRPEPGWA